MAKPLWCHDKGSRTRLALSYLCDPSADHFTFTLTNFQREMRLLVHQNFIEALKYQDQPTLVGMIFTNGLIAKTAFTRTSTGIVSFATICSKNGNNGGRSTFSAKAKTAVGVRLEIGLHVSISHVQFLSICFMAVSKI